MTQRTANHHTFVIEREFPYAPSLVFFAYSNPDAKKAWFSGPPDWVAGPSSFDFSVGGRETSAGGPKGGPMHIYNGTYLEIVPNERIINAFSMHQDETILTASVGTTELRAGGEGTRVKYTEQIVFLDGSDHLAGRIQGTEAMFQLMADYMNKTYGARAGD
ncbi:SRPBCC family protein [Asticcacaulis solisilvae]|uniref:SRPBCC family protein n=1 Tax=Asticcacaulis solisilvae TaxID=1217274 RepID=UPI003FD8956D